MRKLSFWLVFLYFFAVSALADRLIVEPDAGREPLLALIQQARSSIHLVMYGFTDETLAHALLRAQRQGKQVQVLLESEPYKSAHENDAIVRQLQTQPIQLQWAAKTFKLTHQKTLVIDEQTAAILTFNFTHSSFTTERNFALVVTDPAAVQEIQQVFQADWARHPTLMQQARLVWSPENSRAKILAFLHSAHTGIRMYAPDISDYHLIGTLAKLARKGIQIEIITSVNPQKIHNKKFNYLKRSGVLIHNSKNYFIHAKAIMIDGQHALLGSINFTKPSIDENRELAVITDDPEVLRTLTQTFATDWQSTSPLFINHKKYHHAQARLWKELRRVYQLLN